MYTITQADYDLLNQINIIVCLRFEVKDTNGAILDVLQGVVDGGSFSIDSSSDTRRTMSITIVPMLNDVSIENAETKFDLSERSLLWIDKKATFKFGIKDMLSGIIRWYQMGEFLFQDYSITYDSTTNQMAINCVDLMALLNSSMNGQVGQLTTKIPAYKENPDTGVVLEHYYIRQAMVKVLSQIGGINDYYVSDIGEFKGMPQYNANWQAYRTTHPLWDSVPYDLEFAAGGSVLDIINKLRDLYPNYETFFDENGRFVCQMIPSCYYDDIVIPDGILQQYLISESTSRDLSVVRNVTEVWGQVLDTDFYSDNVSNIGGVYTASISGLDEKYCSGDKVALKVPSTNIAGQSININGLGNVGIYEEDTEQLLPANTLEAGKVYVFACKRLRTSAGTDDTIKFFFCGEFQVHAMCVLTDGTTIADGWTDPDTGVKYALYSREYFMTKYDCKNVELVVIPESPFTVQKIGIRLDVKTGDEYENLTSDSLAIARAHYENWKSVRLTDNITLTTLLMPWLDVNTKCSYRVQNSAETKQYIIKSVSHDFSGMTSSITMMSFYPLYEDHITMGGA